MDIEVVAKGAHGVVDHAVALDLRGVRVQEGQAAAAAREDATLGRVAGVEALPDGEGRVAEDGNTGD